MNRKRSTYLWALFAAASLAGSFGLQAQSDITQPGDVVKATSSNSPGSEGVANAIDGKPTKYLNFDKVNTGFTVFPGVGATIVTGLTLQSANDAPDRDPATYVLSGSNDGGTNFTEIATGSVPAFGTDRFKTVSVAFENGNAYKAYKLIFPTTAGNSTCCMQVAEIELLGTVVPPDVTQPGDTVKATSSNSPGSEGVANAIDNKPTKYLNFDKVNTGFTVTPSVGATIVSGLTLQSANDAPDRDPATYVLSGSNDGGTNFVEISSGNVPAFGADRFKTVQVFFKNTKAYKTYKLIFPTTAGNSTCCMQVAEVELLGTVAPQDVTQPGDLVKATSSNSPGSEGVANAIDNKPTKYLNFDKVNTGFTVTPAVGKTIVTGLTLQSANDAPDRDPATYDLSGSNDGTTFVTISSGNVPAFGADRFKTVQVDFENSTAYSSYKLIFPTTAGNSTCCMQVAEVEFLGFAADSSALPQFKSQPADAPTLVGASATFYVTVNGPWAIQWYKNGVAIAGANALNYSTDPVTAGDDGATYYATAKNGTLVGQSADAHVRIFTPSATKSIGLNWAGSGANGAPTEIPSTDVAGVHQQAYWNNFGTASGGDDAVLKDSGNADSTITVSYTSSNQWGTGTGTEGGNKKILNGYLDPNADGAVVTFANVPAGKHSVIAYSVNRPLLFNNGTFTVDGKASATVFIRSQNSDEYNAAPEFVRGTSTSDTVRTVANFVRIDNIEADASGNVVVTAKGPLNALQLLVSPPPPAALPVITGQPATINVVNGAAARFSVTATGATRYQWRKNGSALSDGGSIAGAKSASLVISGANEAASGSYTCAVYNADGDTVISSVAVLTTYNGAINDRLAGHWKFDEKSGLDAANSATSGVVGKLNGYEGSAQWVAGKIGGALSFDGAAQFVSVADYTKASKGLAVSAWVNSDVNGDNATIIANAGITTDQNIRLNQFELGLNGSTGDLRGRVVSGPNGYVTREGEEKALTTGAWHHVALTANGNQITLYRDGAVIGTVDYAGAIVDATAPCLAIGATLGTNCMEVLENAPGFWTGKLDDVALWTRPLGASEVAAIYAAGQGGKDLSTIPTVTPPAGLGTLSAKLNAGKVVITITGNGKLQSSDKVDGSYADVSGVADGKITVDPAGRRFYKLVQ